MKQPERLLAQLKQASIPKPVSPTLPMELLGAKRSVERMFGVFEPDPHWWADDSKPIDLVNACLGAVARWLNKSSV
jgi:hypothetical protein